jgi:hypothetical protein
MGDGGIESARPRQLQQESKMTEEVKSPPPGVLAEANLKAAEAAPVEERKLMDTPDPTRLPVDPNYLEPMSFERFKDMAESIFKTSTESDLGSKLFLEQRALIIFLLARLRNVEEALKPFAVTAMTFSNARMTLMANGDDSPAGGTWFSNPPKGIQLIPNEALFFNACDAYGRKRIQDYMEETFKRLQAQYAAQKEKDAHVESGGPVH